MGVGRYNERSVADVVIGTCASLIIPVNVQGRNLLCSILTYSHISAQVYYLYRRPFYQQSTLPTFGFGTLRMLRLICVREAVSLVHGHQAFSSLALEACLAARTMGYQVGPIGDGHTCMRWQRMSCLGFADDYLSPHSISHCQCICELDLLTPSSNCVLVAKHTGSLHRPLPVWICGRCLDCDE